MFQKVMLLLYFSLFLSLMGNAQNAGTSRAEKFHNKALQYYHASAYDKALEEAQKAIRADKNHIESWLLAGDIQSLRGFKDEAITSYKQAISIDSNFFIPAYYILANLLFDQHRYGESITYYEKYSKYPNIRDTEKARLNSNIKLARFRKHAMENPVPFKPKNLGKGVNTDGYEFVNYISPDRQRLYFTRRMTTGPRRDEQFYFSINKNDSVWSDALDIGPPINSDGDEGAMTLSPDGQYLFFSGCNSINGYGSCDLYVSRLNGNQWSEPQNLGPVVNTRGWESQPSFSSDGRTLYFVSNRPGGLGESDIWITRLKSNGEWMNPWNAGESVNTKAAERGPFIHPDGVTLYFSSKGHMGMGEGDLFYSTYSNGKWKQPVNLGYPVNTSDDEITMIVDTEGRYAYYSSTREEGYGLQDIYQFELPAEAKPEMVSYMKGNVFDSITLKPLGATINLLEPSSGDTIISSLSNTVDGKFLLVIPAGHNYTLNVEREGYLFYSAHIELKENENYINPYEKDIPLKKITEGESMVLRNIFFKTDSFNLLPESTAELDQLVRLLKKNKGMAVEISGHTDNEGSVQYNLQLSERRARSVYDYLVKSGVDVRRLRFRGYGSSKPVASNDTPEGRSLNRRTEMVVIGVKN